MIIVLREGASPRETDGLMDFLTGLDGLTVHPVPGEEHTLWGVTGDTGRVDVSRIESFSCVERVLCVTAPYPLASRASRPEGTRVQIGSVAVGGPRLAVIAGPCSVESRDQILRTAQAVRRSGAAILRGGVLKPRSSPYAFQGMGLEGLALLKEAREATGLPIVTELLSVRDFDRFIEEVDCVQVGARNMQNYELLRLLGKTDKPVLLKRGLSATLEEWLMSAEYILAGGNPNVILCERGIRTFETCTRNTLDLSAVPAVHHLSHLPVMVDPSHGTGRRWMVSPLARAAVAVGADGLIIEVHPDPEHALSDGAQSVDPAQFDELMRGLRAIAAAVGREL